MSVTDTTEWIERIKARDDLPEGLRKLMIDTVFQNRLFLEQVLGRMELIYMREKQHPTKESVKPYYRT